MSAALQLIPCPALIVDEDGLVVAANERFSEATGVAHTFLLGHEWWQGFASDSAHDAEGAHRTVSSAVGSYGSLRLPLMQADRVPVQIHLSWQRLREPGSARDVWVFAFFGWYPLEARQAPSRAWPSLLHTPSVAGFSAVVAAELGSIVAHTHNAEGPEAIAAALTSAERIAETLRDISESTTEDDHYAPGALATAALDSLYEVISTRPVRVVDTSTGRARRRPADPVRWVATLIAFAHERTPERAPLELTVFDEPGFVCITLRDHGGPLPAESFDVLALSPFVSPPGSLPLGPLRWVRALTRANGGLFSIANEEDGLTVSLSVPAASAE